MPSFHSLLLASCLLSLAVKFLYSIQTPWQKAKDDEAALLRERKGIIEGVPQGFFDDKRKDGMVRETIVNEAHMNEEYERLMRELTEKNVEDEAKAEEEEERDALLRDLANADEQMEKWMRLNAMEKLKEARLQEVAFQFQFGRIFDSPIMWTSYGFLTADIHVFIRFDKGNF
ncbi:hypothetical protein TELCIR_23203 [Teladorsagia circumcincta]|uniref:ZNF380 coiled-coil domain-containing protein n=1 Tax=Teladorsagia circumcincta TaxID=45464 RepID=A0A2G9TBR7_TELCI|nr:hypothetical protein TELCIR_23203 [Teladorsagia circumcincta]